MALGTAAALWLGIAASAHAGGGPENVLLLVNANSDSSKTIANHYIELRQIPPQNVLYIDWRAGLERTTGATFRSRILMPAVEAIEKRRLTPQIDYLVYSSDFPWRIDLQNLFPDHKFELPFDPVASITGATYLAPFVMGRLPAIVMPNVNWYVPGPAEANIARCEQLEKVISRGFRSRYLWDQHGNRTTDTVSGQRYLLSTMLGVTTGRGNTVEEVIRYLRRAVAADGTRPRGTIYFMANSDVRSKTRDKCFASVAAQIQRLGIQASVQRGQVPSGARDVMGVTAGTANFDWPASGSTILPGAICEHLTSSGGNLRAEASQTPLSEFLRHGAAGASGTVKEPRSIQAKFPLPSLHLHYARGCSLAEAFYQSVSGPYQLLIVGDPLCQPWAVFPKVTIEDIEPNQEVQGSLTITPSGTGNIAAYDLFVDGRLIARARPGQSVDLDTTKLADGYHELRAVGVAAGQIETQGRHVVPIMVNNRGANLEVAVSPAPSAAHGGRVLLPHSDSGALTIDVKQPGATAIEIRQNSRVVGRVQGEAGVVEIAAATLGRGPTVLQAFSEGDEPVAAGPVAVLVY